MKRVLNGKTYNTETAELIGRREVPEKQERENGCKDVRIAVVTVDERSFTEELYRRKDGVYFLYGQGYGPYTKAVRVHGNQNYHSRPRPYGFTVHHPGEKIIPQTSEQAEDWIAQFLPSKL